MVHFVFPASCLSCNEPIPPESSLLCHSCGTLLQLIDPEERCLICFNLVHSQIDTPCEHCLKFPSLYFRVASAFDYEGPSSVLVKRMKYGNQRYLAEGMGAFLFAQFEQLGWPIPDMIVPVPISWLRRMDRGFNQSLLLAKELANYIDCPCEDILKRRSGDFSQAALSLEQRQGLVGDSFYLSDKANIKGKTILVIDDVLTSGSTLHRCAEALMEGVPNRLYGLTFCRTSGDS